MVDYVPHACSAGGSNSKVIRPRGRHYEMLSISCANAKGVWGHVPSGKVSKLYVLRLNLRLFSTVNSLTNYD